MTVLSIPTLSSQQLSLALDLLDIRDLAPKESLRKLDEHAERGDFTPTQVKALRVVVKTLDDADAARVLRDSLDGDEECLDLLRERVVNEARAAFVR